MDNDRKAAIGRALEMISKGAELLGLPCCGIWYDCDVVTAITMGTPEVVEAISQVEGFEDCQIFDRPTKKPAADTCH